MNARTRAVLMRGTVDADVRHVVLAAVGPVGPVGGVWLPTDVVTRRPVCHRCGGPRERGVVHRCP